MKIIYFIGLVFLAFMPMKANITENDNERTEGSDHLKCNHKVLEFYGLDGYTLAQTPPPGEVGGAESMCEGIQHTCCSKDDFLKTKRMWATNSQKIKGYLNKIFKIIQKIVMIKSSFIEIAKDLSSKENEYCARIDTNFFNAPIAFDEIYSYSKIAFQSMAFIQKGFYCTICDLEYQKFIAVKQEPDKLMMVMSDKSCNELTNFFREFLKYKIYFLDPFIINANFMLNCNGDTDKFKYDFDYQVTYGEIKSCIEEDEHCSNVCREFRFGKSTDMFMGDLSKYEKFLANFEEFAANKNPDMNVNSEDLYIPEYDFADSEFFTIETEEHEFEKIDLEVGNVSNYQILINDNGIDIFGTAERANYSLTADETILETENDENHLEGSEEHSVQAEESEMDIDHARLQEQQQKLEQMDPNTIPSTEDLNNLQSQIEKKEESRREYTTQTGQINDFNPEETDNSYNNFGSAGDINKATWTWKVINLMIVYFALYL